MGLDITVYTNPRAATADELAAINGESDIGVALVALDRLEAAGRFSDLGSWEANWVASARLAMMAGEAPSIGRDEMAEVVGLVIPYINPSFQRRAADLDAPAYRAGGSWWFNAGSYGGYNRWRETLAELVGIGTTIDPESEADGGTERSLSVFWTKCGELEDAGQEPTERFWQLIHFSDCEGCIGPAVCRKLADDFDAMAEAAANHGDERWRDKYETWRRAFREAGDTGGWVSFH